MKRKALVARCEQLIKSYNPEILTVDSHADEELRDLDAVDRLFLQQIFYGTYRYRELLKPLLTNFLNANSSRVSRNDYTKFMIVGYLCMFRLEEMGFSTFAQLVSVLDPTPMHVFLSYLYDNLLGPIKAEWVRVLDEDFVQTELIGKMLSFRTDMDELLQQLHAKAFGRAALKESRRASGGIVKVEKKPLTVPMAPNLTQPRPPKLVEPLRIAQEIKANPVPATLNQLTLAELAKKQQERKAKIKADITRKYDEAAKDMFVFESMAKSNLDAVRQEVEAARQAELRFDFKAKPAPDFQTAGPKDVKLTTAAILREDALYKKKQAKEAQLIHAYEAELRDPMDFYRWQSDMVQQDQEKWRAEVEKRRLEMVQSQYEAAEAAHRARMENREVARAMKVVAHEMEEQRLREHEELVDKHRAQMTEIRQVRDTAPREAEERVKEEKQKQRDELMAFLAKERERKATEDALEQAQREELIRQIRALDRVHREHVVVFDPTETAQLGLLEEMSLAELRERLQVRKAQQQAWEDERREAILVDKQDKDAAIEDKMKNLARLRQAAASANAAQRKKKKAAAEAKKAAEDAVRKEGNLKLAQKLVAQRAAREAEIARLQEEAEEIAKKRMFLGAAKNMLEESHFDQLARGAERGARQRQTTTQVDALTMETTKAQEKAMRSDYATAQRHRKQDEDALQLQLLAHAREEGKLREHDDDEMLRRIVRHEQHRYLHAQEILQNRNVYATQQSLALSAQARRTAQKTLDKAPHHAILRSKGAATHQQPQPQPHQRGSTAGTVAPPPLRMPMTTHNNQLEAAS